VRNVVCIVHGMTRVLPCVVFALLTVTLAGCPESPAVDDDAGIVDDDAGVAICAVDAPNGACPGRRVCAGGACVVPIDDGTDIEDDVADTWSAMWTAYNEGYGAFAAKPDLDWVAVRDDVAARVDDATTKMQAEWAMSRGVQAIGDGHTFMVPTRLCQLDPGFGAHQSNIGACLEETDDGFVVAQVGDDNPMGFVVGDVVTAFDGRSVEDALHDLDEQPRCVVNHSTPAMLRQSLVHSVMFRDRDDVDVDVQGADGSVETRPLLFTDRPLPCNGVLGPNVDDVVAHAHGVKSALLDGDVSYVWWPFFGAYEGNTFVDQPMLDVLLPLIEDARGRQGLILDVRSNGGGYVTVYMAIAQLLYRQSTVLFYGRNKTGPGPLDFSPEFAQTTPGNPDALDVDVVVLTNARSFSAADFMPAFLAQTGRATSMGAPSGGGFGSGDGLPAVDGYTLGNNSFYATDLDGLPLEGHPPDVDVAVRYTRGDLAAGRDTVVEAARTFLTD